MKKSLLCAALSQSIDYWSKDDQFPFFNQESNSLSVHRTSASMEKSVVSVSLFIDKSHFIVKTLSFRFSINNDQTLSSWNVVVRQINQIQSMESRIRVSLSLSIIDIDQDTMSLDFSPSWMNKFSLHRTSSSIVQTISFDSPINGQSNSLVIHHRSLCHSLCVVSYVFKEYPYRLIDDEFHFSSGKEGILCSPKIDIDEDVDSFTSLSWSTNIIHREDVYLQFLNWERTNPSSEQLVVNRPN